MKAALGILSLLLAGILPLGAQESEGSAKEPGVRYSRRLVLPTRADHFKQPRSVIADLHANETFVCDTFGNRIVIFDRGGLYLYEIPGGSVFRAPLDLAVDPEGYLIVLSRSAAARGFLVLDFDGLFLEKIDLTGLPEGMSDPDLYSIAMAPSGDRLYFVDRANFRVWITNRDGSVRASINVGEGRSEEDLEDLLLRHVDVYGSTVLLAVPTDGRVYLYNLDGEPEGAVGLKGTGACQTAFPVAAALTRDGQVIVLDKQKAMFSRWDRKTDKCLGEHYGFGNAAGFFYQPDDLALDSEGRVYVSQGFEGRVQIYEGAEPALLAGNSDGAER